MKTIIDDRDSRTRRASTIVDRDLERVTSSLNCRFKWYAEDPDVKDLYLESLHKQRSPECYTTWCAPPSAAC